MSTFLRNKTISKTTPLRKENPFPQFNVASHKRPGIRLSFEYTTTLLSGEGGEGRTGTATMFRKMLSKYTIFSTVLSKIVGLVRLPMQCHERSKVLRKTSYGSKETRPFAAHCKKDMLEWLSVPRWPFATISIATQKKKNGNIANVLIILHYLTKLHAFMGKVKNALRIIEKRCNAF